MLDLFFREVNATLQEFARDPQWKLEGQLGFLAVLHTWSQTLVEHVHLHCAVPGGAWRKNAHTWAPAGRNWLFRASSLADRFRNRYLRAVRRRLDRGTLVLPAGTEDWNDVCARLAATDWIVYAKKPFAGPPAGPRVPRTLHPQGRHQRLPHPPARRWSRHLPLPGSRRRRHRKDDDPVRRRLHRALPAPHPPARLPEDPVLRLDGPQRPH
ncbi:MAG: transposase [Kiritimatiellae bacterium]|nr:transposase [Kiritimatiellia bacterium]